MKPKKIERKDQLKNEIDKLDQFLKVLDKELEKHKEKKND